MRFDRRELAGAVADLGVFVPIAVTLIVANGLSATAVLLPAGLLYVAVAFTYRLRLATADAARTYFDDRAKAVRPGRLA